MVQYPTNDRLQMYECEDFMPKYLLIIHGKPIYKLVYVACCSFLVNNAVYQVSVSISYVPFST